MDVNCEGSKIARKQRASSTELSVHDWESPSNEIKLFQQLHLLTLKLVDNAPRCVI